MRKGYSLLIFLACYGFFTSCKTEVKETIPKTELAITVKDENGNLLTNAKVAVFNDKTTFDKSSPSYSTEGAVAVDSTLNGVCHFDNLNSTDNYFISIHYKDTSRFHGTFINLDNQGQEYVIKNKLVEGAIIQAHITVRPADGFITFWTDATNSSQLPMNVSITDIYNGDLSKVNSDVTIPYQDSALTVRVKSGEYSYSIKSKYGCLYFDKVSVQGGTFKPVKLSPCNLGKVSFWIPSENSKDWPITVILNNNDTLGTAGIVSEKPDCSDASLLSGDRIPGNYTYTAISNSSKVVWTGHFTLSKDDCQLIEIK